MVSAFVLLSFIFHLGSSYKTVPNARIEHLDNKNISGACQFSHECDKQEDCQFWCSHCSDKCVCLFGKCSRVAGPPVGHPMMKGPMVTERPECQSYRDCSCQNNKEIASAIKEMQQRAVGVP
eukprot:TRINITY_DN26065_c0_g1_i1.p1 TRINITY_DN26065_c0_g1~~TRINITY_DN26065_c0_g1_i1.p1  ORF type:complete len:122 (+),score=17.98 TRINITY_DN26065_c0_g1_i1:66-431(+)